MRTVLKLISVLLFVVVCLSVWVGIRAWLAKDHLETSADLVSRLQTQVERGDTAPAHDTLVRLQDETHDAVRLTSDPVWRFAQHLPGGDNLKAVHEVSVAGHTVSIQSLPPLVAATASVSQLQGGGDASPKQLLAIARGLQKPLAIAQAGVRQAQVQIAAVDPSTLIGPVRSGVDQFNSGLQTLDTELTALRKADTAAVAAGAALGA